MRLPLILLIPGLLAAADPVAIRADGTGADAGEAIASGAAATTFTLARAPGALFRLPANATASVHVDAAGRAVVDLDAGAIEADVQDRGPYPSVVVRGGAMEVRVTGTLFVVQRVRRDADYVALIQGRVGVSLRQEVLALLGRDVPDLALTDRQGVGAGPGGFDAIDTLASRPVLGAAASIRDQALQPDPDGSSWGPGLDLGPDALGLGDPGQTIAEQVANQVVDQVGEQITEQITDQVTEQVVDQIIAPGLPPLGGPPPLP